MFFSIVTPIYNVSKFVRRGVECILAQDFDDFELILVDDGSTDGSGTLCDREAAMCSKIKVIHQDNSGAGPARNAGIDAAVGEYVAFFDIDDIVKADWLSNIYKILTKGLPQLLVYGYNEIDDRTGVCHSYAFAPACYHSNADLRKHWAETLSGVNFNNGFVWNKVYRREFLIKNSIRFEPLRIQQDEVFNLAAYSHLESVIVTDEVLYDYFVYDKGNTRSHFISDRLDIYRRVRDVFLELVDNWGIEDERLVSYIHVRFIRSVICQIDYNICKCANGLTRKGKKEIIQQILDAQDVQDSLKVLRHLNAFPSDLIGVNYISAMEAKSVTRYLAVSWFNSAISSAKELVRKFLPC
jgi:glycosyltransferase involved in cell wall biosynthesis